MRWPWKKKPERDNSFDLVTPLPPMTGIERMQPILAERRLAARRSAEGISEAARCWVMAGLSGDWTFPPEIPRAIVFEPGLSLVAQQQMAMQNMGMRGAYYGLCGLQQALGRIW